VSTFWRRTYRSPSATARGDQHAGEQRPGDHRELERQRTQRLHRRLPLRAEQAWGERPARWCLHSVQRRLPRDKQVEQPQTPPARDRLPGQGEREHRQSAAGSQDKPAAIDRVRDAAARQPQHQQRHRGGEADQADEEPVRA